MEIICLLMKTHKVDTHLLSSCPIVQIVRLLRVTRRVSIPSATPLIAVLFGTTTTAATRRRITLPLLTVPSSPSAIGLDFILPSSGMEFVTRESDATTQKFVAMTAA